MSCPITQLPSVSPGVKPRLLVGHGASANEIVQLAVTFIPLLQFATAVFVNFRFTFRETNILTINFTETGKLLWHKSAVQRVGCEDKPRGSHEREYLELWQQGHNQLTDSEANGSQHFPYLVRYQGGVN